MLRLGFASPTAVGLWSAVVVAAIVLSEWVLTSDTAQWIVVLAVWSAALLVLRSRWSTAPPRGSRRTGWAFAASVAFDVVVIAVLAVVGRFVLDETPARIGLGLLALLLIGWGNDRQTIASQQPVRA